MFGEEADGLGGGVEKEASDLANKPRQQRAKLRRDFLSPPAIAFPVAFKPFVIELTTAPIVTAAAIKIDATVTPCF